MLEERKSEVSAINNDKKRLTKTAKALKEYGYGKPVNKDPLVEMPKPEMILYRVKDKYFFSRAGLETYCEKNNIPMSSTYSVEYYREFAGCKDVLKIKEKYYTPIDESCLAMYNYDRSVYLGCYNWNFEYGDLREEYEILKSVGINLEIDTYDAVDNKYEYILKKIKEKHTNL